MSLDPDRLARALLADMPDALIVADTGGAIRFWNAGAERIFGFTTSEATGQSLDIIIPENLRSRHWAGYDNTMRTGESRYGAGDLLAVPAIRKDGSRISVEFTVIPLHDECGAMEGIAAILREVTQQFTQLRALRKEVADLRGRAQ